MNHNLATCVSSRKVPVDNARLRYALADAQAINNTVYGVKFNDVGIFRVPISEVNKGVHYFVICCREKDTESLVVLMLRHHLLPTAAFVGATKFSKSSLKELACSSPPRASPL